MNGETKSTWLSTPVVLHSSRAFTCEGFETAEQCEWYQHRWHFWYHADWVYALPTVAFFMCSIGLFILSHFADQLLAYRQSHGSPLRRRITAVARYLSYRGFRTEALGWNSAPLGLLLLAGVGVTFFFCMDLIPQPYYWPGPDAVWGGSPPLATRSGWMSLACMPFVFATASKANWITLLTGVTHEKLQIFHRWISYAFFILALMHTFPFIVYHIRNHDMVEQFAISSYFTYWTGVVALLFQAWLTFASFGWIRNLSYEFFKAAHFVTVICFVLFFFWHCGAELTSWDYFIATAAVYVPCLVYPWLRTLFEYGIGQKAQLVVEDNDCVRITIPANFTWIPGQHCFLRFYGFGIHALTSHPFTICSLPSTTPNKPSRLVFYVRLHGGFTRKLYEYAEKQPGRSVPVLVDGPYAGIDNTKFFGSNRVLVIAGGSGAAWSLPFIEQFIQLPGSQINSGEALSDSSDDAQKENDAAKLDVDNQHSTIAPYPGSLRVVLATRDITTRLWFQNSVSELVCMYGYPPSSITSGLEIEVYLTGEAEQLASKPKIPPEPEKSRPNSDSASVDHTVLTSSVPGGEHLVQDPTPPHRRSAAAARSEFQGRLSLSSAIQQEAAQAAQTGQSMGVFVCGPETMQQDVRNAVAKENLRIVGTSSSASCGGVYLHLEHFSWA